MEAMVEQATGVKFVRLHHHDTGTVSVEEVVLLILARRPAFREIERAEGVKQGRTLMEKSDAQGVKQVDEATNTHLVGNAQPPRKL